MAEAARASLTVADWQHRIASGEVAPQEAIAQQWQGLQAGHARWRCATWVSPEPPPAPAGGPLRGLALAHKDIFDLPDRAPGVGAGPGAARPGLAAAPVVERLHAAGAVTIGALSMAEFACGATGANDWQGACVNPLNETAVVGGSSSGSAAAVAAGLVAASLGTDTAGSVRIPAATCGLVGLKPTQGALPLAGVFPLAPALDGVGVIARSAEDVALLWSVLRGGAPASAARVPPASSPRVRAWLGDAALHDTVARTIEALARELDAHAVDFAHERFERLSTAAEIVLRTQTAATHAAALRAGTAPPRVADIGLAGLAMPAEWADTALQARAALLREFVAAELADADVLLLPALGAPIPDWGPVTPGAPDFQAAELVALFRYMGFVNYLGLPALVVPVGTDARGLPVSVQFIARPHQEDTLLWLAARVASAHPFAGRPPSPCQ